MLTWYFAIPSSAVNNGKIANEAANPCIAKNEENKNIRNSLSVNNTFIMSFSKIVDSFNFVEPT